MAPRPPNYGQERGNRERAKEQKKMEKLNRRAEESAKRKLLRGTDAPSDDEKKEGDA
jgi:hypothetical protein